MFYVVLAKEYDSGDYEDKIIGIFKDKKTAQSIRNKFLREWNEGWAILKVFEADEIGKLQVGNIHGLCKED